MVYVFAITQKRVARESASLSINAVNVMPVNTGRRTVENHRNRIVL